MSPAVTNRHNRAFDEVRPSGRQRPGRLSIFNDTETPNGAGHALSTMEAERWSYRNQLEDS
ncbi:hypothetical protein ACVITL_006862 [Rhizobium pisi]